ncbi:CBS domain [Phaffia rhodozyma]|uniref:CBS domain n=1 Tax=Phaffia rhodozyma TaxID=264483 RepID=A0A0F7SGK8_PHARH|nr:CBS domain [Phaffia rhodozyma]
MSVTPTDKRSRSPLAAKYRGAVIEDLQLPPAICLGLATLVIDVLSLAYDREFDQIPVLTDPRPSQPRRLLGYVDVKALKELFAQGKVQESTAIADHYTKFPTGSKSTGPNAYPYTTITPLTPLAELENFFSGTGVAFALVTDEKRRLVYGIVTKQDLETFVSRRNGVPTN